MTLSPTISRWSSPVFFSEFLHLSHAYVFPLSKKTSSRFLSAFSASNSLHIFQLIPCKSLWDLTSLVSWGDKCFLCDELGYTDLLFLVQPNLFGTTEAYHSVLPISVLSRHFVICILHICSSSTQWFLSSTSITFYMLLCSVTQGPNLCIASPSKRILLGNWCQRGRESSHES